MSYHAQLLGWQAFYTVTGTASAALVGLLFVGLALHLRHVVSRPDVRGLARVTLGSFAAALVMALIMVVPDQGPTSTGADLLGLGVGASLLTATNLVAGLRSRPRTIGFRLLGLRFGLVELAYIGMIASGVLLLQGAVRSALDQLLPVTVVLLVVSVRNTWDVLVSVGAATLSSHPHGEPGRADAAQEE